ncbi:hypothetical protein ACQP2F_06635 [Actinoplanes sp. CA-030573]|uniref:hypothetical protein n=1 Tax=Actinoplanes sp. CA-030573 TaxID=3239898 RepID=UPI003D91941D
MKFFSNEAKENEPEYDRENSDVVTSEPVAVPQQRAGSPWSDAPASGDHIAADHATDHSTDVDGSPDDELADRERRDGTEEGDSFRRDETSLDGDSFRRDDTARDTGLDDTGRDDTGRDETGRVDGHDGSDPVDVDLDDPATRHDEDASRRDAGEAEAVTYGPDGTVTPASTDDSDRDTTEGVSGGTAEDAAIKDEGTFESPEVVDPATGDKLDESGAAGRRDVADENADDRAGARAEADETVDEARADEERAEHELDGTGTTLDGTSAEAAQSEPVPVAAATTTTTDDAAATTTDEPAAATPGSVPAPALDRLFAEGDSFADRFRDIQLRFVDSPKEATAEAAALVGEAVDKLTSALKAQKDALAGESDDTEQLRVQLRSYRDLLNRLSAL